jgi:uncharacterized protein (TIGR02453 family)
MNEELPFFNGFSKEAIGFLKKLKRNNRREWFKKNKPIYDSELLIPSRLFVESIRPKLRPLSTHLIISPRSISRIYRDIRFKKDKTPYKTEVSFLFWDARGEKNASAACYFAFDTEQITYGVGLWYFMGKMREWFRERITETKSGNEFSKIIKSIRKKGTFEIGGKALKRMPPLLDADHKNSEFFLHNGIFITKTCRLGPSFYKAALATECAKTFLSVKPFFDWCTETMRTNPY